MDLVIFGMHPALVLGLLLAFLFACSVFCDNKQPDRIVGIAGFHGAGKKSAALFLVKEHKLRLRLFQTVFERIAVVVDPCIQPDGLTLSCSSLTTVRAQKAVRMVRDSLEAKFGKQMFVRQSLQDASNVVFADVTCREEANGIKALGGIIIRISRPGVPVTESKSERMNMKLIEPDIDIVNDGSLENLRSAVLEATFQNSQ